MSRPSSTTEREIIQEQLIQAKKTLARLRQISDSPTNGEPNNDWNENYNVETRSSSRAESRRSTDSYRYSTAARDNLVQALGYQVSKLEDDLKSSLLSYFEQVERQKDDLINSFNVMQKQLLNHQQACQEQTLEAVEKDAIIRDLKDEKQQLESELERMSTEKNLFDALDNSIESMHSESLSNFSGYASDKSELSERLIQENAKLREMLGHQRDDTSRSRLERKVELQSKLCHSYDKDLASKDLLIKRLKAENKGLLCDVQTMQDEVLRVNANRLSAEQDKSKLQQENHFKDEEIYALREQLDSKDLHTYQRPTSNGNAHHVSVDEEIIEMQRQCDNYKRTLHDKDKAVFDLQREKQDLYKNIDSLRRELSEEKHETQRMKRENERLQRENADRDIERLSSESTTKASNTRINQLKDKLATAEYETKELQRKCEEAEKRESDLTKEVLTNLEKYSQTEQELYSTKKELAHLKGYTESHDKYNDEIQRELMTERENSARLEKELWARNYNSAGSDKLERLENENRQLKELNAQLEDELNRSQSNLNQLDSDMESLREQCSIQKVRLDGQEKMILRKDERIKELQDELVELHNQNDALMDALLKTNRPFDNFKKNKRLGDLDNESHGTSKVPKGARSHRDALMTPDSGYYENPRNTSSSEGLTQRRPQDLQKELDSMRRENNRLKEDKDKMESTLKDMEKELQEMKTQVERQEDREQFTSKKSKEKENGLYAELDDMKKQLSALKDENESLRGKSEELEKKLAKLDDIGVSPRSLAFNDQIEALESAPEVDLFGEFEQDDKNSVFPKTRAIGFEGKTSEQQHGSYGNADRLAPGGPLIDFGISAPLESTEADSQYAGIDLIDAGDEEKSITKKDIENYEAQIKSISEDKDEMEAEIKELRSLLDKAKQKQEISKKDTNKFEVQRNKEIKAKDNQLDGLRKELSSEKSKCNELKTQVDDLKKSMKEKDYELKNLKSKIESQAEVYKSKLKEIEDKAKDDEHSYEVTQAKLADLEHEIEEFQGEKMDNVNKFRELQREKRNLQEDIDLLQGEKNKMEKKAKEFEKEKDEIAEKYEEAKRNIKELKVEQRKLQEEKDDIDYDLNEILKQRNREIKKLNDDLEASESKYDELRATWDSSNLQSSDLKNDLMRAKEECIELTNKNEELYAVKKEMIKDLDAKEDLVESLREKEETMRNRINDKERAIEKLQEKYDDIQQENLELQEESNELRKALETTNKEQRTVETLVEKLKDDLEKTQNQLQENNDNFSALEEKNFKINAENDILKDKLSKIEKRLIDLQKRDDAAQTDLIEAEKRAKMAEKKSKELTASLTKSNDDLVYVKNKLSKAENKAASLEEAQSETEEKQKMLQRKLQDATNELNDLSLLNKDQEDRQKNIDKRITELRDYSEELETERDDLEFTVKEMKKKLEKQKKKVQALEDELLDKQKEKDSVQQELDLLKLNAFSTESEQSAHLAEREKLKKDMLEASKMVMDLEAENDAQKENIEELEKLLDQKRASVLDLEDNIKETSETVVTLQVQHEEDQRLITTLQEDNANLEKMLEKQKQLSEGYKGSLAQKDTEISKLAFSRDDAEDALQLLKKDLARREGVNKANQQELDEVEKKLSDNNKKLQETKAANDQLSHENERLLKELEGAKKRLLEMDSGILPENFISVLEVEPLSSRRSSASSAMSMHVADNRIKTLDEKLSKAQNKVTDLENELSKEIRKHEIDCIKTRPTLPYSYGKRSGFYDVSGASSKYGTKIPESDDNDDSDDEESHEVTPVKKSMDSKQVDNERESKGIPKSKSEASSTSSPAISVTSFNFQDKADSPPKDKEDKVNETHDSFSEESSGDDEPFEYSVGNLNDLLSEMNEAERQDPILQKYLNLEPEGTSSPRADDTFDSIEPSYLQRRGDRLSLEPIDTSASDITNVTSLNEPLRLKSKSLIDLESTVSSVTSLPEEAGTYDRDQPSDVIDPFSTPFDIPNWEDEFSSSFDSTRDLIDIDDNVTPVSQSVTENITPEEKKKPVDNESDLLIEIRERDTSNTTSSTRNNHDSNHGSSNVSTQDNRRDNALDPFDNESDVTEHDIPDGKPRPLPRKLVMQDFQFSHPSLGTKISSSEDEQIVFRKPSEIIKELEDASFSHAKPGMKPPRPKKHDILLFPNEGDVAIDNKPHPKPRSTSHHDVIPTQRIVGIEEADETREHSPPPKQVLIDLEPTESTGDNEDRRAAIGRKRVLNLIAAFEGKEV